jgi:polysaccharide pyruvyl transferase WcaK-like protein
MTYILLYLVEPAARERSPVRRSLKGHLRAAVARGLDRFRWRVLKDFRIDYDAWRVVTNTNKGDAAIREAITAQLASLPFRPPVEIVEVGWGELTEQHVARLNETRGLFVIAGGGYFFFGPDNALPRRIERDIELIRRMTCARIAYGPGVNQIRTGSTLRPLDPDTVAPRSLGMLSELAAQMDLVAVRDQSSRDLLAAVHRGPVRLIGDPALFLDPTHRREARAGRQPALVGLNFALHGPNNAASLPERMRWIVPLLRRMREAWQCRFRYVMHSDVERVFPLLLRQHGIETEVIDAPVQATLDAYTALDLHLCQMLHSSILAVAAGTPTVNIGYDAKNLAFFDLMGIADLCFEPKDLDPERVFERAARLHEERAAFAAAIGAAKRRLGEELARFHAEIVAVMAGVPDRAQA